MPFRAKPLPVPSIFSKHRRLNFSARSYELVEERFEPRKSDRLLAANPVYKKIPVLILPDGRAVCESAVIAQYADEAWADGGVAALLPDDPYERAKFWPALDAVSLAPTKEARGRAIADTRAALLLPEEAFAARSDGRAFFFGRDAAPGLLDVALGCFLPALWACERLNGVALLDEATTLLLKKWSERFAADPACWT